MQELEDRFLNVVAYLNDQLNGGMTKESLISDGENICKYLRFQFPEDTYEHWAELVDYAVQYNKSTIFVDPSGPDQFRIPIDPQSCWQLYYSKIKYSNKVKIQQECHSIINQLKSETTLENPVKGLIVGNVQSGKTLNMAGVISMAMDYRWNVIIILTGMIDSLRKQTTKRLKDKDLKSTDNVHSLYYRNITWLEITKEGNYNEIIRLNPDGKDSKVYITTCLKQADDLRKLLKHLNRSKDVKSRMRVLVIDDEADQASINTSDLSKGEDKYDVRKTINKLIISLVSGYDCDDKKRSPSPYKAMNYLAYTATPYANLLSEDEIKGNEVDESVGFTNLYPKDFVKILSPAKEYFGPTQIFGYDKYGLPGLNIINDDEDTNKLIKEMVRDKSNNLPDGLKDSIAWFICCVVIKRKWVKDDPISMLVNPDVDTETHSLIADNIERYIVDEKDDLLKRCREVYLKQKSMLTPQDFMKKMGSLDDNGVAVREDGSLTRPYCTDLKSINDYPEYDLIESEIKELIDLNPECYEIGDSVIEYNSGIHICIDNCKNNDMPRIVYPDKNELNEMGRPYPNPSPAFIVIGGNTLSRGLTIEGLVSTYFSRNLSQADVSMQMCRWFGYRVGYELLPRIWMSKKIHTKYEKTIAIDESIREFIFENYGRYTPEEIVAKIRNYPGLRATSKTKSRGSSAIDYDYTGYTRETCRYYADEKIVKHNMEITVDFLKGLQFKKSNFISSLWAEVDSEKVLGYIKSYKSPDTVVDEDGRITIDIDRIEKTIKEKNCDVWRVILGNPESPRTWININDEDIGLSGRSRGSSSTEDIITLSSRLINPRDQYADCDKNIFKDPSKKGMTFDELDNHTYDKYTIREGCGVLNYPVLIVYGISGTKIEKRGQGLGIDSDVIGICVQMPGKKSNLGHYTLSGLKRDVVSNKSEVC